MIFYVDTMIIFIDEYSIGVVELLIKENFLYYKYV